MLSTGAGVVVFNDIIHNINDFVWPNTPVNNANWVYWARDLPLSERWVTLLLPPASGGLAVGLLRYFSKGFENPPPNEQQQQLDQKLPKADGLPVQPSAPSMPNQNTQSSAQPGPPPPSSPSWVSAEQSKASAVSNSADSSGENSSRNSSTARIESNGEASSSGTSTLWSSASLQGRVLSVTRPLLKATAAAITLGTGNSLGPEGPSVEIGRAAARGLGTVLKSKQRRLLSLVAAGSGAGDTS